MFIEINVFCYLDKIMHDRVKSDILDSYKDVVDFLFRKCNKSEQMGNIPVRVSNTPFYSLKNVRKIPKTSLIM